MSKRFAGDYESFQRFNEEHKITYCDLEAEVWEAEELLKEKDEEIEGLKTQLNDLDEILDERDAVLRGTETKSYDVITCELDRARELMQWFCTRCEKGEVRSTKTYNAYMKFLKDTV